MAHEIRISHSAEAVSIGDRGRLVLPARIRKELGLQKGSKLLVSAEEDGSLRLRPYGSIAEKGRGMLADLASSDVSLVDELISERRQEARREGAKPGPSTQ